MLMTGIAGSAHLYPSPTSVGTSRINIKIQPMPHWSSQSKREKPLIVCFFVSASLQGGHLQPPAIDILFQIGHFGASVHTSCGTPESQTVEIKWRQIGWKTGGGPIRNRPCTLGRPIRIRPCILGRPIRIRRCILGRSIRSFGSHFYQQPYSKFHFNIFSCFYLNRTTNLLHPGKCNIIQTKPIVLSVFRTQFSFLQHCSQPTVPSRWNLQDKTDTLECLLKAVTHPSTNIAKPCLSSQFSLPLHKHVIYAIARQNICYKG